MQIALRTNKTDLTEALRSYIERRLRFSLGRFGSRVGQVAVRLGSAGPNESCCRISAEVLPFGRVAVEERDPDLFTAIDRATGRIGHLFGRQLQRARDSRLNRDSIRTAA
ncbi:MAG TPA: HPF/RaiA family ribosome-associated protein [Terriglobales bacterium]|nr:HPF/RaiA family ribosome-associated protein [Terriglobales bacterium]